MKELTVTSGNAQETTSLGEKIGRQLQGGEVIELVSDLGGGKTQLVRGLAAGMGSADQVQSPTFTVSRVYASPKLELHHFDFYRLNEPGIVALELAETLQDPRAVVSIEWADTVQDVLPEARVTVTITATGETGRRLVFHYPPALGYLFKRISAAYNEDEGENHGS